MGSWEITYPQRDSVAVVSQTVVVLMNGMCLDSTCLRRTQSNRCSESLLLFIRAIEEKFLPLGSVTLCSCQPGEDRTVIAAFQHNCEAMRQRSSTKYSEIRAATKSLFWKRPEGTCKIIS